MAYIDRSTGNTRAYVMTAVAALHGAALYALITGLDVDYVAERIAVISGHNIPIDKPIEPPPAPPPVETSKPQDRVIVAPRPAVDVTPIDNRQITTAPAQLPPLSLPPAPVLEPTPPSSSPSFAPRSARAIGKPGNWVTSNDYPARDLREGNQGRTSFALTIGADGKVQACAVTRSSGFAGLDAATCEKVTRRARFEPARDGDGAPTTGTYASTVAWRIPE